MLWPIFLMITCGKFLFLPSYRSTDFEVHRNWLAITHSLPLNKWYVDATSQWTLDYPPLFAWFEYLLSHVARLCDPEMLKVENLNYASEKTILFQRISVIVTDIVYALGALKCLNAVTDMQKGRIPKEKNHWFSSFTIMAFLLICNVGIFMVDHIHFQYNGFLTGILLLSVGSVLKNENIAAAFWFSILLNLKHIYLYIAPAYFVYLFRSYCIQTTKSGLTFNFRRFLSLGGVVISIFLVSFGPFLNQIPQVLSRLFPFENRGLCHAYWAPNFWALYNVADKALSIIAIKLGWIEPSTMTTASMTGGLVKEFEHVILPSVGPKTTLICTLVAFLPALIILLKRPNQPMVFLRALILCAFASFLFGWHVHEKAILMVIIPFTLLAVSTPTDCRLFLVLSAAGHTSLFPLLFTPFECTLKVFLVFTFWLASYAFLVALLYEPKIKKSLLEFHIWERLYMYGLIVVGFIECLSNSIFTPFDKFPFLPLLLMSVYCAVGVIYVWLLFMAKALKTEDIRKKQR
nr:EOG090X06YP [Macrothrix elegans]